jgi:hypothetical protein
MAERSHVTSIDAIEAFRANLIVYLKKARPVVEEVPNAVLRTRFWLENEQRNRWHEEIRVRRRKLEEAQQELLTAKMSNLRQATIVKEMAMRRALQALREAEEKLARTKTWARELENLSAPLLKQVEQLHSFLTSDLSKAVAYLAQVVKALQAYTDVAAPGASVGVPDSAGAPGDAANAAGQPQSPSPEAGAAAEGKRS